VECCIFEGYSHSDATFTDTPVSKQALRDARANNIDADEARIYEVRGLVSVAGGQKNPTDRTSKLTIETIR
jgi:hypothetical protein